MFPPTNSLTIYILLCLIPTILLILFCLVVSLPYIGQHYPPSIVDFIFKILAKKIYLVQLIMLAIYGLPFSTWSVDITICTSVGAPMASLMVTLTWSTKFAINIFVVPYIIFVPWPGLYFHFFPFDHQCH